MAHTGREAARESAAEFCRSLHKHGIGLRLLEDEAAELTLELPDVEVVRPKADAARDCELVIVIGGDGTILRAAEMARECNTPLLGVNLGHVGFLAEAESDDIDFTMDAVVNRRYVAEERLTIDVAVYRDGEMVASSWALNDASVEKAARERVLEGGVEVDGRPLSRWGCDGVVCATPTGSTAYNFSAGGPIVWPGGGALLVVPIRGHPLVVRPWLEALLMVPITSHSLFARPLVVAPRSVLAVEVMAPTDGAGVLWADG